MTTDETLAIATARLDKILRVVGFTCAPGSDLFTKMIPRGRQSIAIPLWNRNREKQRCQDPLLCGDYDGFLRVLDEALARVPMRILAFVLMPNHWHFVLWPVGDRDLSEFCRWLTHTHSMRWHAHHHTAGTGHIYQGRFKSFAVETDDHLYTLCRYVERNPLRANLVARAEDWRWGSLWRRVYGGDEPDRLLTAWPFGSASWQAAMAARQGLGHTLRPLGRPRNAAP